MAPEAGSLVFELLKYSVLLPVAFALAWFCWIQHKALRDIEEKRVDDIKSVNDKLINLSDKWNESVTSLIATSDAQRDVLREIKEALQDLRDDIISRVK